MTYFCHLSQGLSRSWRVLVFYSRVSFIVTFAAILYHSVTKGLISYIFIYFNIGPNVTKIFYSYSVARPQACPLSSVQRVQDVWWQESTVKRRASVLARWNYFVIPRLVLWNGRRCLQRGCPQVFCWDSFWFSKYNHTSLLTWIYSVWKLGVQNWKCVPQNWLQIATNTHPYHM